MTYNNEKPRLTNGKKASKLIRARACAALCMLLCAGSLFLFFSLSSNPISTVGDALLRLQMPFLTGSGKNAAEKTEPPVKIELVDIDEGVGEKIRIELLNNSIPPKTNINLEGKEPRILIYHTHTTEAYTQTDKYSYDEKGDWRTDDNTRNIVTVGEKLATLLSEKYGISVIHDITDHEPPKLSTAYSRSVKTMEKYKSKYPSITLFIDVHRDAYDTKGRENTDYVVIDGKRVARMMFVVGTGEGATGTGFGKMPDFQSNYALAKSLTEYMLGINGKLMRNIRVKTGRYNQHITNQCLLIEVGHNANTLEESLNAVEYLAEAIAHVAGSPQESGVPSMLPLTP